ncbi:MAG: histidine--tRNA ligase [Bacteriovoracaceae bacterium]|jgi:histidyl-tRNA synthetase|nr:histidine--tRNA ligase [Bacteriovoracaceae bacterium]
MGLSKKPYRGTRDFFPENKRIQDYIFEKWRFSAEQFGYEAYDGPFLEEVDLYRAKSGQELIDEQIYSFTDRGERFVAIRPEMTPTLARMISGVHTNLPKPIRWYSIPNLYRYEKPQRGRLREHWQFNVDVFGAPEGLGEIEIVQLIAHVYQSFGATSEHFELLINDRKFVDFIFNDLLKLSTEDSYKLYKIVDRSKKINRDATKKSLVEMKLPDEKQEVFFEYLDLKLFSDAISFAEKNGGGEKISVLKSFHQKVGELNLEEYCKFDPCIVRGLDYYTGIVFECFDKNPDNKRALCGGGSYENLLKIFDEKPLSGIGFGMGDVTMQDFLKTHDLLPDLSTQKVDILLTSQIIEGETPCLLLANQLRAKGLMVSTQFGVTKLNKAFGLAEKRGAKFIGLIGDRELADKKIQIKNLKDRNQHLCDIDEASEIVKFLNHEL